MNGNPPPPKKEVALALLERGSVHVHLDPRASGVVVPAWFKRQPQLVLQVGLNMPVPIPDLRVDEDGMSCTLSFNRSPFFCIVPWSSVYAMVGDDGRGMVWPQDVPPEVALSGRARDGEHAAKKPAAERQLAVVKPAAEPTRKAAPKGGRPRAARADREAAGREVEKKPRTKKPRATEPAPANAKAAGKGKTGEGVLVQIPAASKPARAPAPAPAPAPARAPAPRPVEARREPPAANGAVVDGSGSPKPRPAGAPSPGPGKPGKVKREIPPYLRVVK